MAARCCRTAAGPTSSEARGPARANPSRQPRPDPCPCPPPWPEAADDPEVPALPPELVSEPVVVVPAWFESEELSSVVAPAVFVLVVSEAVGPEEFEVEPDPSDPVAEDAVDPDWPQSDWAAAETAWPWPGPVGAERATLETY